GQVLRVEEEVMVPRLRGILRAAREAAGEVAHVATEEVLPHERLSPAGPGECVPAQAEDHEGGDAGNRPEIEDAPQLAVPQQEEAERRREERGGHGSPGE